jgi:hypothetical protein
MGRWLQLLKNETGVNEDLIKPSSPKVKSLTVGNVSFVGALHRPFEKLSDVLLSTPFTLEMILEGVSRWKQPFDDFDLEMIQGGSFCAQQVIDYLVLWVRKYPGYFEELIAFDKSIQLKSIERI